MSGLVAMGYGSDDDSDHEDNEEEETNSASSSTTLLTSKTVSLPSIQSAAPAIVTKHDIGGLRTVDQYAKELNYNPKFDELYCPVAGPSNPFKTSQQKAHKNMLTGFVEPAHISRFNFETERQTFTTFGYAKDPSADTGTGNKFIGDSKGAKESDGATVFESKKKTGTEKRKRTRNWDPCDVEGYLGPWGKYVDEATVAKPDPETLKEMEAFAKKKKKLSKTTTNETIEEKTTLHIKDTTDYQGRTFMHPPQDVGVNLREEFVPERCFVPKKQIHTWSGHNKGVQAIRWFPKTAHMLLSASMDCKMKLWEVYRGRRCIRTYMGHRMAVKDICFNNDGSEFLSSSFDRYMKLWDTETGQCKSRFTTGKIPFCVKFNPDQDKQHFFLSGMQDKKVIQWDTRSGEIVQEYDRHLGPVNTIAFFDNNRRFCTTSDDKSLRIWEWEIPVDTKLIQDASLHSMPTVTIAPNKKWLVGQAMDNRIVLFQMIDEKLRFSKKKAFRGHMVASYACSIDFSPDMSYIMCGDADGKLFIWDWKTHKIVAKWKAHENVCIGCLWHPHETSKIATCGWDGLIKFWD